MCHLRSLGFRRLVFVLLTIGTLSGPWSATSRAQPSGGLTLLYALPEPESTVMRESVLPAWQERYSDVEIQVIEAPMDSLMSRYAQELEAGTSPLVLIAPAHWGGSLVGLGCCLPRPTGPRGEVWELSVEAMTVDDELLGHPLGASTVALVYNASLITAPPRSTDELREMAASIASSGGQGFGLTPSFYLNGGFFNAFGGQVFDEKGEPALDSPEVIEFLDFLQSLANEPGVVYGGVSETERQFLDGQLAMTVGGPELVQAARDVLGADNVGVAMLPAISERGDTAASPFFDVTGIFVSSKDEAQAEVGFTFAEWMATDGAQILIDGGAGLLPVSSEVRPPDDPAVSAFLEQAEMATVIPSDPGMDEVWEPATEMIASVLEGQASPKEAAAVANEQVDKR